MKDRIIGPFFFQEATVTNHSYLDMSVHYAVPQLPWDAWFQQDATSPFFGKNVRQFLNERFPNKWIGRGGSLHGPRDHQNRRSITKATATVADVMFVNMWREIEHRFDVFRASNGAHIETC
jgi:hypothetical protein